MEKMNTFSGSLVSPAPEPSKRWVDISNVPAEATACLLSAIAQKLTERKLQNLCLFGNGCAYVTHKMGCLKFVCIADLAYWLETGQIPKTAYQKFAADEIPARLPISADE